MKAAVRRRLMLAVVVASPIAARPSRAAPTGAAELSAQLNDRGVTADARLAAADRLAALRSPDARKALADALVNFEENPRLAAARALADEAQPDRSLIEPLFVALSTGRRETAEAVARALSRYADDGDVLTRLIAVATRVPANPVSRREVLRVLGAFVDKRSASLLVQVQADPNESPVNKAAAAESLADMTATPPSANPDWTLWWQAHQNQRDADFRAGLLALRSNQLDLLRLRDNQIRNEIGGVLRQSYASFAAPQRPDTLLRYLQSGEPQVRAVGTAIASEEAGLTTNLTDPVREQLRLLISDVDPDVRAGAANAIFKINDPAALPQLKNQLGQETVPKVRVALARALGVINDASVIPQLLSLLDDVSSAVVSAAASALNDQLSEKNQRDNPQLASTAADALQTAFRRFPANPSNEEVRQAVLQPMAKLKEEKLFPLLNGLLAQQLGESPGIRRLALDALGNIGTAQAAGAISNLLRDTDRSVRLSAVRALGSNPSASKYAVQLMQRCDPNNETDSAVQDNAWNAVSSLLPTLDQNVLQQFADQLRLQPERRLPVLQALAQQLLDQKNLGEWAGVQQNIGDTLVTLGRHREAAGYFKSALDTARTKTPPAPPAALELLAAERMDALLQAGDFVEAIGFANEIDRDPSNIAAMGSKIINYLERLISPPQPPADLIAAKVLADEAHKLNPPLTGQLRDRFDDLEKQIGKKPGGGAK